MLQYLRKREALVRPQSSDNHSDPIKLPTKQVLVSKRAKRDFLLETKVLKPGDNIRFDGI